VDMVATAILACALDKRHFAHIIGHKSMYTVQL